MKIMSDAAFAEMQDQVASLRAWIEQSSAMQKYLIEQLLELKRDGFARPTAQIAQAYEPPKLDDRIMAAIRTHAAPGSHLERELVAFAEAALIAENEIEDVADRILAGSSLGDDDGY